jgi:hypothetical protein
MVEPIKELKSTPFTEVIELERIVTPDEEKRLDHIFVRRKKICTRHPEGFATEEIARFDVAWPEEPKEELKDSTKAQEEVEITNNQ